MAHFKSFKSKSEGQYIGLAATCKFRPTTWRCQQDLHFTGPNGIEAWTLQGGRVEESALRRVYEGPQMQLGQL